MKAVQCFISIALVIQLVLPVGLTVSRPGLDSYVNELREKAPAVYEILVQDHHLVEAFCGPVQLASSQPASAPASQFHHDKTAPISMLTSSENGFKPNPVQISRVPMREIHSSLSIIFDVLTPPPRFLA